MIGSAYRTPGIIPARAGFTRSAHLGRITIQDHPRSRGVYAPHHPQIAQERGSSPLARGLRRAESSGCSLEGIIPARAGFTRRGPSSPPPPTDHPRSRGVYGAMYSLSSSRAGSSPLARGLRGVDHPRRLRRRIIPARAGFTRRGPSSPRPPTDHPRSRGVYAHRRRGGMLSWDHPRSRGVYDAPARQGRAVSGIIPARAGFTGGRSH